MPFSRRIPRRMRSGLIACAAILILWIVSLFVGVLYQQKPKGLTWEVGVANGCIFGFELVYFYTKPYYSTGWHVIRPHNAWNYGLVYPDVGYRLESGFHHFVIPLWTLLLTTLLIVGMQYRKILRRPIEVCKSCQYDLTHNTSGICPECGIAIPEIQREQLMGLKKF